MTRLAAGVLSLLLGCASSHSVDSGGPGGSAAMKKHAKPVSSPKRDAGKPHSIDGEDGGSVGSGSSEPDMGNADPPDAGDGGSMGVGSPDRSIHYVFVVPMENQDATRIIGNMTDAPYINRTLLPTYASASAFVDVLPVDVPSEPHYIWMEAGTNVFSDIAFVNDDNPSASNSTSSKAHLVTQLDDAKRGLTWLAYQEGIDATSGACPIESSGYYQPKHDPFIFFRDVAGSPPSKTNANCAAHHKPLSALTRDLSDGKIANYNFVTPDQCHDMHGQPGCPNSNVIAAGDQWLASSLPPIISFINAHGGVLFVIWDEGEGSATIPFIAMGPGVKKGYVGKVGYTHGSLVKSVEKIFDLPVLPTVASDNDFSDLFRSGTLP